MGLFSKLFKGPEPDMEKSAANSAKMRELFDAAVPDGQKYRLIFGYTEDVSRFNYGFVHGSKTKIGNLIVGWDEQGETIAVVHASDLAGAEEAARSLAAAYSFSDSPVERRELIRGVVK